MLPCTYPAYIVSSVSMNNTTSDRILGMGDGNDVTCGFFSSTVEG
mgnify:CR=1 FL=1